MIHRPMICKPLFASRLTLPQKGQGNKPPLPHCSVRKFSARFSLLPAALAACPVLYYCYSMTVTIDLIDSGALNLLWDMERLNLIRVNHPEKTAAAPKGRPSERFAGALRLSAEKYAAFQNALDEGRSAWE
jgi:hypothetical protein